MFRSCLRSGVLKRRRRAVALPVGVSPLTSEPTNSKSPGQEGQFFLQRAQHSPLPLDARRVIVGEALHSIEHRLGIDVRFGDDVGKEVCAQCLQKHVDPATGKETIIFSCLNQDQLMDHVDFKNLNTRLQQNTVQEKLSSLWLDHVLT